MMNLNDFIQDVEDVAKIEAIRAYQKQKGFYDMCIEEAEKALKSFKRLRKAMISGKERANTRIFVKVLLFTVGLDSKIKYMHDIQNGDDLKDHEINPKLNFNSLLNSKDFDDMIKRLTIGEVEEVSSLLQLKDEDIEILKTLMKK